MDTREKILQAALRLFAQDGYEAVSVARIAGELGMAKGALYNHFRNKRAIFDCIFDRVVQEDVERAKKYGVPEDIFDKLPFAFKTTSMEQLKNFVEATFRIWLQNEFARNFRKMLTLEQYRNIEMGKLYKMCIGQDSYIEDLFREMMENGILKKSDPKLLALQFFAPYHYLLNVTIIDSPSDIEESATLLTAHIEKFIQEHVNHKRRKV
jgi:AcrR family transcriptional regulator